MRKFICLFISLVFAGGCVWVGFRHFWPKHRELQAKRAALEMMEADNERKSSQIDEYRRKSEMLKRSREFVELTAFRKGKAPSLDKGYIFEYHNVDPKAPVK